MGWVGLLARPICRLADPPDVFLSDCGVQYASGQYTRLLRGNSKISISRNGNPYDNAKAESFMKTLEHEQVYLNEYENLAEARAQIGSFWRPPTTRSDCISAWATCRLLSLIDSSSRRIAIIETRTRRSHIN